MPIKQKLTQYYFLAILPVGHFLLILTVSTITLFIFSHQKPTVVQPSQNVRTTLYGRRFDVLATYQRPYNVVLKSYDSWENIYLSSYAHCGNLILAQNENQALTDKNQRD